MGIQSTLYFSIAQICKILKLVRIFRIGGIISNSNFTKQTKTSMRVVYITFILILYTHVVACIFWLTFSVQQIWYPPVHFMYLETHIFDPTHEQGTFLYQYLTMMYESVLTFAKVEICPRSNMEIFVTSVVILISSMVNAQIFGVFAGLVEELNARQIEFEEEVNNANDAMTKITMEEMLRVKVRRFILRTFETRSGQEEFMDLFERLAPSMRRLIEYEIFKDVLMHCHLFEDMLVWLKVKEQNQRKQLIRGGGRKIGLNYHTQINSHTFFTRLVTTILKGVHL